METKTKGSWMIHDKDARERVCIVNEIKYEKDELQSSLQ